MAKPKFDFMKMLADKKKKKGTKKGVGPSSEVVKGMMDKKKSK